jgi:hypothetical protein
VDGTACWYNSITFAGSDDGGKTFTFPPPPQNLLASVPYQYDPAAPSHYGYFEPSNIVRGDDGHFYFMHFSAFPYQSQAYGSCLMRSSSVDPGAANWTAWDGTGFGTIFVNPYTQAGQFEPNQHVCKPVTGKHGRLTRWTQTGEWLMVVNDNGMQITYQTSPDLVTWSSPQTLDLSAHGCSATWPEPGSCYYPSILDPQSPSVQGDRNFQFVAGNQAYLYLVKMIQRDTNRQLLRVPIQISSANM